MANYEDILDRVKDHITPAKVAAAAGLAYAYHKLKQEHKKNRVLGRYKKKDQEEYSTNDAIRDAL